MNAGGDQAEEDDTGQWMQTGQATPSRTPYPDFFAGQASHLQNWDQSTRENNRKPSLEPTGWAAVRQTVSGDPDRIFARVSDTEHYKMESDVKKNLAVPDFRR
jgi:hypothetical protein